MFKKLFISLITVLTVNGCAINSNSLAEDGSPIVATIKNNNLDTVRSKLLLRLSTAENPWILKSESPSSLLVTKPCGSNFGCSLLQLTVGNSYSTPVQFDLAFTLIKDEQNIKVIVSDLSYWSQMPGGQVNTERMSRKSASWAQIRKSLANFEEQMNVSIP